MLVQNAAGTRAWIANGGVNPNAAMTYKIMYVGGSNESTISGEWAAWDFDPFDPLLDDWLETQIFS